jgi:uncharacterized BrkB/YihY/UPF0761 family membrane protein
LSWLYGAFAGAIVLVASIWLTNVALLFAAELNAEIERHKELREGCRPATRSTGRRARSEGRIRDRPQGVKRTAPSQRFARRAPS